MRLDRINGGNRYAIIDMRKLKRIQAMGGPTQNAVEQSLNVLRVHGLIETGEVGSPEEFFVLKLKDQLAEPALMAYAVAAQDHDKEYSADVWELSRRSGRFHPLCKLPD